MNPKIYIQYLLYALCLYNIYLYLPDLLDLINIEFYPPDSDILTYFDAAMLLIGGVVTGVFLRKQGGNFNRNLGLVMILMNIILTPIFIFRALP